MNWQISRLPVLALALQERMKRPLSQITLGAAAGKRACLARGNRFPTHQILQSVRNAREVTFPAETTRLATSFFMQAKLTCRRLYLQAFFAAIGFGMAALTLIQFYRHRCAFIVKSSDYMLSMGMLFFFAISFLSVALLLVEPSNFTCKSRVVAVLPWPVLYVGCILIKTNRLRVLFRHSSKLSTRKILLLRNKTQGFFITSLAFITAAFLFLWVALDSIEVRIVHYEDYSEKACSLSNTWMGVYFGGNPLPSCRISLPGIPHAQPPCRLQRSILSASGNRWDNIFFGLSLFQRITSPPASGQTHFSH